MWKGYYRKWNPVPVLEDKELYVEAVHDDWEGFRIWISAENRNAGIVAIARFENALLYTNSDESFRLSETERESGTKFPHLFWTVENSLLINEFHRQSLRIYEDWKITHYAFLSGNDCLDVLSVEPPQFTNIIEELYAL